MTRNELLDKYWLDFLKWCTTPPDGKAHELVFWLDHHFPQEDHFWEWMVEVNKEALDG